MGNKILERTIVWGRRMHKREKLEEYRQNENREEKFWSGKFKLGRY